MRPLIVVLLVLLAGGALVYSLGLFDGGAPETVAPVQVAKPGTQTPEAGRPEMAPAGKPTAAQPDRTELVVPLAVHADEELAVPGKGNRLVGSVRDDESRPVVGAEVKLTRDAMMGDALVMVQLLQQPRTGKSISVKTDGAGRYVFEDVAPWADYFLIATHPEFSPQQESLVAVGESGEFPGPDIVLRPGARLVGTVKDVGGNAVPDAKLVLESAFGQSWEHPNPDRVEVRSDNLGYYEFKHVPAGQRSLLVHASGYGIEVVSQALEFKGEPGEEKTYDFTLEPGLPIVGQVVGPDGVGVGGARVVAMTWENQVTSRNEATADQNGRFQVDDLQNLAYILMVKAEGYEQARMNRIQAGKVDVVIELKRQATVSGHVVANGKPVKDFDVELRRTSPTPTPDAAVIYESTDLRAEVRGGDGSFSIVGVTSGHYSALVTAEGFAPTGSTVFQVIEDQAPPPMTISLAAGGSLRGRVLDPSGAPLAGVQVRCADNVMSGAEDDPFFGELFSGAATPKKTRTNSEGYFELAALAPATYAVTFEHGRFASLTVRDKIVAEGQSTDLGDTALLAGGSVTGVVRDQGGQPLARAFVQLVSTDASGLSFQARTDASGQYTFNHVRPGSYKISATRQPPGSSADPFQAILEQQASELSISVADGVPVQRELSLGS
jgi:protocatechuate 3,4-dioxygenase beta subunit